MSLAKVLKAPPVVSLAPSSGVQFLDFGFVLKGRRDVTDLWSIADDPAMETPTRADMTSVAYRRWLKRHKYTYGAQLVAG